MAEGADQDQKTQEPTQQKLTEAARNGDILQSRELATAIMVGLGAGWVALAGMSFVANSKTMLVSGLTFSHADIHNFDPAGAAIRLVIEAGIPLMILFAGSLAAALGAPILLRSFGFHTSLIAFKGNRIDPMAGLKRIFGLQGVIELGKAIAKTILLGGIGWWLIADQLPMLWGLVRSDLQGGAAAIGAALIKTLLVLALGLIVIAMLDVPLQRFQRQKRLRMTMQEVKDELRKSEGAPELKLAQRQRQHEVLAGSARRAVTEATMVLTNPTHFAVALRYDPDRDAAPVVVARGRGDVALAIKGLARDAAVPVLEYPQLTRAIYFTTQAGRVVPEDLFVAVATILAFVFNLDRALAEGVAQPEIDVPLAKQFDETGRKAVR